MSLTLRLAASASVCGAHLTCSQTFYKLPFSLTLMPLIAQMHFLPLKQVVKSLRRSTNEALQLPSLLMSQLFWRKKNSDTRSQESHTAATGLPNTCGCRISYGACMCGAVKQSDLCVLHDTRENCDCEHMKIHTYIVKDLPFTQTSCPSKCPSFLFCPVVDFIKLL